MFCDYVVVIDIIYKLLGVYVVAHYLRHRVAVGEVIPDEYSRICFFKDIGKFIKDMVACNRGQPTMDGICEID